MATFVKILWKKKYDYVKDIHLMIQYLIINDTILFFFNSIT